MKKIIALILALMLCLSMAAMAETAPVEPAFTLIGEAPFEDAKWIDGTSLIRTTGTAGYGIGTIDGALITEEIYGSSFSYDSGVISVAQLGVDEYNAWGLVRTDGTAVIPCQYGDVKVLNSHWAVAVKLAKSTADNYDYTSWSEDDVYLLIETADIYNLDTATCVDSLPREHYNGAYAVDSYINVEDRATGAVATMDANYNVISSETKSVYSEEFVVLDVAVEKDYDTGITSLIYADGTSKALDASVKYAYTRFGYVEVENAEGKVGLVDFQGNVVLPMEYEKIGYSYSMPVDATGDSSGYCANGYFAVVVNGKLGYVTEGGAVTCEAKFAEANLENNGMSALYTDMEGNVHIMAADGVDTVVSGYERVSALDYCAGLFYRCTNEDYTYDVIDWHGNVLLENVYYVTTSGDGCYALVSDTDYNTFLYELTWPAEA